MSSIIKRGSKNVIWFITLDRDLIEDLELLYKIKSLYLVFVMLKKSN